MWMDAGRCINVVGVCGNPLLIVCLLSEVKNKVIS